jgi:hypothetical protein
MNDRERDRRFRAARAEVLRERSAIHRDTWREIERILHTGQERIAARLAGQPSDYQRWSLPPLRAEIQSVLHGMRRETTAALTGGADAAWQAGQRLVDAPLAAAGVPIQGLIQSIDPRQLGAMKEFLTHRISDISLTALNRVNSELGLVLTGVQSPGEAIGAITRALGESSRGRALTITRTELGRAFSVASHERSLQAKQIVPGLKKQWRRSGKLRARPAHDAIDGQIRELDQPFDLPDGTQLMFPRDPAAPASETINCGCVMLNYMESWDVLHPAGVPFSTQERIARHSYFPKTL